MRALLPSQTRSSWSSREPVYVCLSLRLPICTTAADASPRLRVERVLRAPVASDASPPKSFCQCWAPDGSVFAAARDRRVTLHDARRGFALLLSVQLRLSVTSMDLALWSARTEDHVTLDDDAAERVYLLAVGTAFGVYLHRVELRRDNSSSSSNQDDDDARINVTGSDSLPVLAAAYEDAPVCFVRFSHDGATIALGTVDGRLFVRQLRGSGAAFGQDISRLAVFGIEVFAKVLAAPRVTSICFAPCDTKLAAATRKGNVYVLSRTLSDGAETPGLDKWRLYPACRDLSSNPRPSIAPGSSGAGTSSAAVAVAMQTFVCWWGSAHSCVLVVASRAANYRIDLIDASSGKLVHAVQAVSRRSGQLEGKERVGTVPSATGDGLLIGVCCVGVTEDGASRQRLLCHDTSSSLSIVAWSGLDVWAS